MSAIHITHSLHRDIEHGKGNSTTNRSTGTGGAGVGGVGYGSDGGSSSTSVSGSNLSALGQGSSETSPLLRSAPTKHLLSKPHFIAVLLGVWSANFVIAFQAMAVPTMMPAVSSWFGRAELASYLGSAFSLGNAAGEYPWITYLTVLLKGGRPFSADHLLSSVIPLYGVIMDTLGRKFAMNAACLVFAIGTVACALSTSMYMLIGARALAGVSRI